MSHYLPQATRSQVYSRANFVCEYCLIHQNECHYSLHVDHVIGLKHGGPDDLDNLACACVFCNLNKGTDLGSIDWATNELVRFFNPRKDRWSEHFRLEGAYIQPLTKIGEVTVRIFGFNSEDRLLERSLLIEVGSFPSAAAMEIIGALGDTE
jgi:hypothetical protein